MPACEREKHQLSASSESLTRRKETHLAEDEVVVVREDDRVVDMLRREPSAGRGSRQRSLVEKVQVCESETHRLLRLFSLERMTLTELGMPGGSCAAGLFHTRTTSRTRLA